MTYDSFSSPRSGFSPELLEPFFSTGTAIPYRKGQIIYMQGQEPRFLYCLKSGTVKTGILSDEGEEKLLTTYEAGSIFGEASFFDGMARVSTAVAQSDCQVVRLSHEEVDRLFLEHPSLARAMITYLARTVRLLSGHVDTMSFQTADKRLARLLLNHPDAKRDIRVTHDELASALGVSRVTVSRLLSSFSKNGYVETGYGCLRIKNEEALRSL